MKSLDCLRNSTLRVTKEVRNTQRARCDRLKIFFVVETGLFLCKNTLSFSVKAIACLQSMVLNLILVSLSTALSSLKSLFFVKMGNSGIILSARREMTC
jgi:hypothetical protein